MVGRCELGVHLVCIARTGKRACNQVPASVGGYRRPRTRIVGVPARCRAAWRGVRRCGRCRLRPSKQRGPTAGAAPPPPPPETRQAKEVLSMGRWREAEREVGVGSRGQGKGRERTGKRQGKDREKAGKEQGKGREKTGKRQGKDRKAAGKRQGKGMKEAGVQRRRRREGERAESEGLKD
eukprot:5954862-Pleurochrysis_carterae.AAC.2